MRTTHGKHVLVDLACGDFKRVGAFGLDRRVTAAVDVVCDTRALPLRDGAADDVSAVFILEHLANPYLLLDEVHRILKPAGVATFRVPNLGTYSAHLDLTHVFLADLRLWKVMLSGYFGRVHVRPIDTKYRDNPLLVLICRILIKVFRFYEFAQVWDLVVTAKIDRPTRRYEPWWASFWDGRGEMPSDRSLPDMTGRGGTQR